MKNRKNSVFMFLLIVTSVLFIAKIVSIPPKNLITIKEVSIPHYAYDAETDTLIYCDSATHTIEFINLSTRKTRYTSAAYCQQNFYASGKYFQIDGSSLYDLSTGNKITLYEHMYDYDSNKDEITDLLNKLDQDALIYFHNSINYTTLLIVKNNEIHEYNIYDEEFRLNGDYLPFVPDAFEHTFDLQNDATAVGLGNRNYEAFYGSEGYGFFITNERHCDAFKFNCSTSQTIKVVQYTEEIETVQEFVISSNKLVQDIVPFPQGRKEVFLLGSSDIRVLELK